MSGFHSRFVVRLGAVFYAFDYGFFHVDCYMCGKAAKAVLANVSCNRRIL